jgi:hypothetical protein
MRKCKANNRDKTPCRMKPLQTGDLCFSHDPQARVQRDAARALGGAARKKQLTREPLQVPPDWWALNGLNDAKGGFRWVVRNLVQGELDARTANALCGALQNLSTLIRDVEFEARLLALEHAAKAEAEDKWAKR